MSNDIPSEIPKPPKAIGISKRLFATIALVIFIVIVLFLVMLNHYTPKPIANNAPIHHLTSNKKPMDNSGVSEMITHIQSQGYHPMIVKPMKPKAVILGNTGQAPEAPTINTGMDEKILKDASNASLSVYHSNAIAQPINTGESSEPLPTGHTPVPNIGSSANAKNTYASQNMQNEKTAFLKSNQSVDKDYIHSKLIHPINPFEVQAGSIIPATMVTAINSDLPGPMIATVRENVYDSATGNYLLIPQGTKLIGTYDSQIAYGQSRVLIVWSRLIFPDGTSYNLDGMPGADLMGMAGLSDQVDNHYFKIFGSALMFSVFGAAGQLSQPQNNSSQLTAQQIIAGAVGQQLSQTAMQLVARNMNIQPTIKIRPGDMFNVLLTRDMVLPHPYQS